MKIAQIISLFFIGMMAIVAAIKMAADGGAIIPLALILMAVTCVIMINDQG